VVGIVRNRRGTLVVSGRGKMATDPLQGDVRYGEKRIRFQNQGEVSR